MTFEATIERRQFNLDAIARLREALAFAREHAQWPTVYGDDLRALLDAHTAAEAERDALRAQADAVRALCARFERGGGTLWPGEVLAAMGGATP